ncbi:MAG: DUF5715 family protein [Edaphobacter sp.]
MMRLNALFPALLALAALFLLPATLLAKPQHRHASKTVATHRQTHKKAVAKPRHKATSVRHKSVRGRVAPTRTRASRTHRHLAPTSKAKARRSAPRQLSASDASPRKASSSDFLKAAAVKPEADNSPVSRPTVRAANVRQSRALVRKSKRSRSVAKPVSVVSVVRPTAEKPQLPSIEEEATQPAVLPVLYNKRGRLVVPPPLKGSREILLHQNEVADREGLDRVQNNADLLDMRSKRMLVPLPASYALQVDDRLPADRRYSRPWTAQFLSNMARAHYARFHSPLQINSAVRTVEFQQKLIRVNGNAAPAEGDTASPHLTGQAVDIAKHGLSLTEIAWMRGYLLPLIQEGKIDVEEEFQQACFHISVYKKYLPPADMPRRNFETHRRGEANALATAIR